MPVLASRTVISITLFMHSAVFAARTIVMLCVALHFSVKSLRHDVNPSLETFSLYSPSQTLPKRTLPESSDIAEFITAPSCMRHTRASEINMPFASHTCTVTIPLQQACGVAGSLVCRQDAIRIERISAESATMEWVERGLKCLIAKKTVCVMSVGHSPG